MSNHRIHAEETPEGRIAAVVCSLTIQVNADFKRTGKLPAFPDYADYRAVLAPFLKKELLLARLAEAKSLPGPTAAWRVTHILDELADLEKTLPKENNLKNRP